MNTIISTDQQTFLDKIYEEPDDDTPRLVYADWLDEQEGEGRVLDAGRAELIRVQHELSRNPPCPNPGDDCIACLNADYEFRLLAEHGARWRTGPLCERCHNGYIRFGKNTMGQECPTCYGSSDAGGLRREFTYRVPHRTIASGPEPVQLTYRTGFVERVSVPTMAHLVEACGHYSRLEQPTTWLTAVARHWPTVTEAVPLDRVPYPVLYPRSSTDKGSNFWRWWCYKPYGSYPPEHEFAVLPEPVYELLRLNHPFPTAEATVKALGRTFMTWTRSFK